MHRTLGLALLATLSAGCSSDDKDDNKDFVQPQSTDDTATSGTDGGATLPGEDPVDDGPCPAYSGIAGVGTTWEYRHTDGSGVTSVHEITAFSNGSGERTSVQPFEVGGETNYITSTAAFSCDDDGMWLHSAYSEYATDPDDDSTIYSWAEVTYDEPLLQIPRGVVHTDTWSVTASGYTETSAGTYTPFTIQQEYVADLEETIDVPSGSYDTLRVEIVTYNGTTATNTSTMWVAWDVGAVLTEVTELINYSR